MKGIGTFLHKDDRDGFSFCHIKAQLRRPVYELREGPLPDIVSGTLILDFLASMTLRNKFPLLVRPFCL